MNRMHITGADEKMAKRVYCKIINLDHKTTSLQVAGWVTDHKVASLEGCRIANSELFQAALQMPLSGARSE
jgi:hypothetical protein